MNRATIAGSAFILRMAARSASLPISGISEYALSPNMWSACSWVLIRKAKSLRLNSA